MKTLNVNSILKSGKLQYKIEKVLGQGSFGITYLASTTIKVEGPLGSIETPVKVAIKEFFMRDINGREEGTVTCSNQNGLYDRYKEKFIKEAQSLSRLSHRHIIKVLEVFEANNTYYYVMEFCGGGSLDDEIAAKGTLSEEETRRYAGQIADALGYMHVNKMLHLDLKPGNIMLRGDGDVVLIDFGLSKQYDENGHPESSTTIGGGTPGYAPLEQSNYDGKGFPKTMDIYALGGTMFKMLTGKRPPEASIILNYGFPSDELRQQGVSEQMICCIEKAMSFRVADRPQNIAEFLEILDGKGGAMSQGRKDAGSQSEDDEETRLDVNPNTDPNTDSDSDTDFDKRTPITPSSPKETAAPKTPETPKKKKRGFGTFMIVFLGIMLFVGIVSGSVYIWNEHDTYCAMIVRGDYNMSNNNLDDALAYYNRALSFEERYYLFSEFGLFDQNVYYKIRELDEKMVLKAKDDYLQLIANGDSYLKKNKTAEAKAEYNKALEYETKYANTSYSHLFDQNVYEKINKVDEKIKKDKLKAEQYARTHGSSNGHNWVDLGLSVKWATCNVGANKPEDYGDYYAWGETKTKSEYWVDNSVTYDKSFSDIKGDSRYDAARANWGGSWRLPTEAELNELKNKCRWKWTTQNGVNGYKVTGPNGNSIFLPAAGYRYGSSLYYAGEYGYYWSSTPDESNTYGAYYLYFTSGLHYVGWSYRGYGRSVRPVTE